MHTAHVDVAELGTASRQAFPPVKPGVSSVMIVHGRTTRTSLLLLGGLQLLPACLPGCLLAVHIIHPSGALLAPLPVKVATYLHKEQQELY